MTAPGTTAKSLPLILARELASNLATPMFLMDSAGMLVYYNEAAELLIGRPFAELGEIPAAEFGEMLKLRDSDGSPLHPSDTASALPFAERGDAHRAHRATGYNGVERAVEATAFPLFGEADEMHGVVTVFWLSSIPDSS